MSMIQQIIDEQLTRARSGQINPRDLPVAVKRAYTNQLREEALFRAGMAEFPGRNYELMEQALAENSRNNPSILEGFGRNLGDIASGVGTLLYKTMIDAPLHPIKTAEFVTRDVGRLADPSAWGRAWDRTLGPGEMRQGTSEPPASMAEVLQDIVAQTGRGYKDLFNAPVDRFRKDPLFTIMDVLPLWSAAAGGASKLGLAGRTASGASKLAPGSVAGALGRGIERALPEGGAARKLIEGVRLKRGYGNLEAENLGEHFAMNQRQAAWINKYTEKWIERLDKKYKQPGMLREITMGLRPAPVELGEQGLRDLQAYIERTRRRTTRYDTRPQQQILGKLVDAEGNPAKRSSGVPVTEYRPYAPMIDRLTGSRFGEKARFAEVPEAQLMRMAEAAMPANPIDRITIRNHVMDISREGGTARLAPRQGLKGNPRRAGDVIEFEPLQPVYSQDIADLAGPGSQYYMMPTPRGNKAVSVPGSQRRAGGQVDVPMVQNLAEVQRMQFAQVSRAVQNEQFIQDVLHNYSRELTLADGTKISKLDGHASLTPEIYNLLDRQGLALWSEQPAMRFFRQTLDLPETIISRLRKEGANEVTIGRINKMLSEEFTPESLGRFVTTTEIKPNDTFRLVPKQVKAELDRRMQARGMFQKFVLDGPLDAWRPLVLGTPRWIVNNAVGNFFLASMAGVGPVSYGRALKSFWHEWQRKHGKRAYAGLDQIPAGVDQGFIRAELKQADKNFGDIRRGGAIAESVYGAGNKLVEAPLVRQVVKGTKFYFGLIQEANGRLESFFRRAVYLRQAVPAARKRAMRRSVDNAVSSQAMMDELGKIAETAAMHDPIVSGIKTGRDLMRTGPGVAMLNTVNEFLFDYMKMTPFERRWVRSAIPFYAWYKNIFRLVSTLPVKHPGRAKILESLSAAGREAESDLDQGMIPDYWRGSVKGETRYGVEQFSGEPGMLTRLHHTRAMNPLSAVVELGEWPNMINPIGRALMETASRKDMLTGRPFELEGTSRDILTGKYYQATPRGIEEAGRNPSREIQVLLSRLFDQVPPARLLRDAASGGRPRFADSFGTAQPDTKRKGNLERTLRSYAGFPISDVNLERLSSDYGQREKRSITQEFKRIMREDPDALRRAVMQIQ